jgi:ElaB/YqjD/DUF883 family membrane-anchored ribosome-binding protein
MTEAEIQAKVAKFRDTLRNTEGDALSKLHALATQHPWVLAAVSAGIGSLIGTLLS